MTTPNPWERLREAVNRFGDFADHSKKCHVTRYLGAAGIVNQTLPACTCGFGGATDELREALAALPATPPQQPASDAERERAIEAWRERSEHMMTAQEGARWVLDGVALMRSAPAPQPVPAPSIGESLASAGTHYVNPRTMQPVSTKVPAPPASDWRTDLGVTGNIGTGTVLP